MKKKPSTNNPHPILLALRKQSIHTKTDKRSQSAKRPDKEVQRFECDLLPENNTDASQLSLSIAQQVIATLNGSRRRDSERGVRRLLDLAVETINELERLWKIGNPYIRAIAGSRTTWPVLTGHHSAILKRNAEWIESIELGLNVANRILLDRLPTRTTPARLQALRLLGIITQIQRSAIWGESIHDDIAQCDESFLKILRFWLRQDYEPSMFQKITLTWPLVLTIAKLPRLGPEEATITRWQKVSLEFLSLNCSDNPASIPELCVLGEHRRFHPYPATVSRDLLKDIVRPETQLNNISREIREILKDEIRKICEHVGKLTQTNREKGR
jgi:hypothetical protein